MLSKYWLDLFRTQRLEANHCLSPLLWTDNRKTSCEAKTNSSIWTAKWIFYLYNALFTRSYNWLSSFSAQTKTSFANITAIRSRCFARMNVQQRNWKRENELLPLIVSLCQQSSICSLFMIVNRSRVCRRTIDAKTYIQRLWSIDTDQSTYTSVSSVEDSDFVSYLSLTCCHRWHNSLMLVRTNGRWFVLFYFNAFKENGS